MSLKILRIKRNLNQTELSKISGVGLNTIVKIEKGNIDGITVRTLKKLAAALDTTVADLFFTDEN